MSKKDETSEEAQESTFEELLVYLKRNRGFDFTGYKRSSLRRRVRRRMSAVKIDDFEAYQDYLEVHPREFEFLFNTILINVTAFFRNELTWDYLAEEIVPRILRDRGPEGDIRVWSAGCASGEEPYSVAMVLAEALGVEQARRRIKIYATDVDEVALAQARQAVYSAEAVEPVPAHLLDKYFVTASGGYAFNHDLRRVLVFGRHDLMQDAPISRLDLLLCRNTLIYFNHEAQKRIVNNFHFALRDTGYLFLGRAEMLLTHADLFTSAHVKHRVFAKAVHGHPRRRLLAQSEAGREEDAEKMDRHTRLQQAAFETTPIAEMVVDRDGILALANDRARIDFGVDPRDVGRPFHDLEISYRPVELRSLIDRARDEGRTLRVEDVERALPEGEAQFLDVQVVPIRGSGGRWMGVSISFVDVTQRHHLHDELDRSKQEVEIVYRELQSANEELQSTVEELQTTNEELQSTNEEMETMNEELQAANAKLQTMNDELRQRTLEADRANAFLESIVASVNAGMSSSTGISRACYGTTGPRIYGGCGPRRCAAAASWTWTSGCRYRS
jgi:two-component system CheB/CheR fusion protein